MRGQSYLRRLFLRPSPSPTITIPPTPYIHFLRTHCTKIQEKWLTLPPYTHTIDGSSLGKQIYTNNSPEEKAETTAFKWIIKCCPQLPRSLVQKLFRLRQVLNHTFWCNCYLLYYKFDSIWVVSFDIMSKNVCKFVFILAYWNRFGENRWMFRVQM